MDRDFLKTCLFFNANRLSRIITKLAEEEFAPTGLSPMYGYLLRLAIGTPGIMQKELSDLLYITPSTLTRFVDKLEAKQLVRRQVDGKTVRVFVTEKGLQLEERIRKASKSIEQRYVEILGEKLSSQLSRDLETTSEQLEEKQ